MSPKQKPLPTPEERAQLNADRAEVALENAIDKLTKARTAYRQAERTYAKAKELAEDAAKSAGRIRGS
jgi:exonuclease VII small subunit